MRFKTLALAALFASGLLGVTALPAGAEEGILYRVRAGETNYCHLKFPAIQPETLSWDRPVLKPASTSDVIDFYGPCKFDPTGEQAVETQRRDRYEEMVNRE